MKDLNRIKELVNALNKASLAYYKYDKPIMSDKQYDDLYDELEMLEIETGIILAGSPTQHVQGYILKGLEKVNHTRPMLSANKTKDVNELKKFIGKNTCVLSWKEDGLTIVLRYKQGKFVQAITRGTGEVGEDVTHTMKTCKNIPVQLPYKVDLEVRGECLISWIEFNRINKNLSEPYKHPRNLAAGSVRQLDSNVTKERNIVFKAFELVQDESESPMNIKESFDYLNECGFDVVENELVTYKNIEETIDKFNPDNYEYPVDGLIITYDDYAYGKSLGTTSKFPLNMMALKWLDDLYETTLEDIEWSTTRTGQINPVAVFAPVDLDGAITTRATLHNVSIIEELELGIGDTIQVYRSNKVIPKVHDNLTRSNTCVIPETCPCCGHAAIIQKLNDSKVLCCENPDCSAQFVSKLSNFVNRNGMNIVGLSEATLELLVDKGYVKSFVDLYHLSDYKKELSALPGFGARSVSKLLKSIEDSRNTDLTHFLTALGIPQTGKSTCKDIASYCKGDIDNFVFIVSNTILEFMTIDGIGRTILNALDKWWNDNNEMVFDLLEEIKITKPEVQESSGDKLQGMTFVITGTVKKFKNRTELQSKIESLGGKVSGSVSKKTNVLINNDANSNSSKNLSAQKYGVEIWTEDVFLSFIGE